MLLLCFTAAVTVLWAQEEDKVHLISAQSAQIIEKDGQSYRKVVGPAKFLHNDTYLLCDTALWNVNTNIIDAVGNVRILQDRTKLTSATLQYVVDENMAKFRGDLVQLEDSDKNILRTRYLDYNTKDSVAVFQDGAAMRDKDGQVIESLYGTYDSKAHLFVFNDQVNMYMDTTFVKTSRLEYRSDLSTAYFGYETDMWQDDKMLSANDGWYDRGRELFLFRRKVHLLTKDQETWSDSLYYYRALNNVEMLGHVEIMDTTRNVFALAGRFEYTDSLSEVRMTREPAVMSIMEEKGRKDTLYVGADFLHYRAIPRCDIPESWIKDAEQRLKDIGGDPVMEYRRKAAEAARKAAEEAAKQNQQTRPPEAGGGPAKPKEEPAKPKDPDKPKESAKPKEPAPPKPEPDSLVPPPVLDSLAVPPIDSLVTPPLDSLAMPPVLDSLAAPVAPADTMTVEPPKDTTKVNFIWGSKRVRMFRSTMQMAGDSLIYTDLDSLVRMFQDPIVFNEGNRQYAADSIYAVIKNKRAEKAHLLSNAFITIQEDSVSFDQISGTEMVAYFDSTSALTRFDALGGASSLFFLEEKGALATVNKVEAKMIYSTFKDGEIERMFYYENPKNDGYPSVQLPKEDRTLKGYRWEPERRPKSPRDVTSLEPRPSQRTSYLARPHTEFKQTNLYFPGYINKVYRDIAIRDSLTVLRKQREQWVKDSLARAQAPLDTLATLASQADSLAVSADSLAAPLDSLKAPLDSLAAPLDSLAAPSDSLAAPSDSLAAVAPVVVLSQAELRAKEKAEKEAEKARKKAEKQAALEAKWAEEDRIFEEKQAAKAQKKLDRERARKLKELRKIEKRAQKDRKLFDKYLAREQKKALKTKTHKKH